MSGDTTACDIRAAVCSIADKPGFLLILKEIAQKFNTHIICFNADVLAGRRHAESAVLHAIRSFRNGGTISNSLEMEALLYAAGSRQCTIAASFGIHEGENRLWVCCYPPGEGVWDALTTVINVQAGTPWEIVDQKKREKLIQIFNISMLEIDTPESPDRITDLVLERVALLDVMR